LSIPYTITPKSINVLVDGRMRTLNETHPNYSAVKDVLKNLPYYDSFADAKHDLCILLDIPAYIARITEGRVQVCDNAVLFDGKETHNVIATRMLEHLRTGTDVRPLARFMQLAETNPDLSAYEELFIWLESNDMPLTEDGHLIAFKKVNTDYYSYSTGTNGERVRNMIGDKPSMPRSEVDPDRYNTCSRGLHFCSYTYLPSYYGGQGRVMIVKINPADVVAIPNDYNNAKGRAWTYEVVGEVPEDEAREFFKDRPVVADYDAWPENTDNCDDLSTGCCADDDGDDAYNYLDDDYDERDDNYNPPMTHDDGPPSPAEEPVFVHNGAEFSASTIKDMVARNGQRGFSRLTGVARTTLQGWLAKIGY